LSQSSPIHNMESRMLEGMCRHTKRDSST
jgi:hypothetical protein